MKRRTKIVYESNNNIGKYTVVLWRLVAEKKDNITLELSLKYRKKEPGTIGCYN